MRYKIFVFAGTWLFGLGTELSSAPDRIQDILDNPPFLGISPVSNGPKPDPKPTLELRGLVMEGGVAWFTLYDSATKKWSTIRQGEESGVVSVKEYDRQKGFVIFTDQGKAVKISLGPVGGSMPSRATVRSSAGLVARVEEPKQAVEVVEIVPSTSASETKRLEQVASVIRQHLEAAKIKSALRNQNSS